MERRGRHCRAPFYPEEISSSVTGRSYSQAAAAALIIGFEFRIPRDAMVRSDGWYSRSESKCDLHCCWLVGYLCLRQIFTLKSFAESPQQGRKFPQHMDHHYDDSLLFTDFAFLSENERLTSHAYPQLCMSRLLNNTYAFVSKPPF